MLINFLRFTPISLCFSSGLCYKHMMIVNENSSIINKLIDDARVVIYYCNMFIIQATESYQHTI